MKEIKIDDLIASGYREDRMELRRAEWTYTGAIVLGLMAFVGGMFILDRGSMAAGFAVSGLAWAWMIGVILARYYSKPRDSETGEKLEKCKFSSTWPPNEEIILVNHHKKTFCRRVVARRNACPPTGG